MGNSIGIITLSEPHDGNKFIEFLNNDDSVWYKLKFHYDDSNGKWDYPNPEFMIVSFHPDYYLFNVKCIRELGSFYEVEVNHESGLTKKMRKSELIKLISWEDYVLNVFSIGFDDKLNPICENKEGNTLEINLSDEVIFQPVEIQGEWMKIKWSKDFFVENPKFDYGWVKWKEGNKIIIELYFFA